MSVYTIPETPYQQGYNEGRRTALHLVVPLAESSVYASALAEARGPWRGDSFRAYWLGFARAMRLHYDDAYMPNVLQARRRRTAR